MGNKRIYGVPPLILASMPYVSALGLIIAAQKAKKDSVATSLSKVDNIGSYEEIAASQELHKQLSIEIEFMEKMLEKVIKR